MTLERAVFQFLAAWDADLEIDETFRGIDDLRKAYIDHTHNRFLYAAAPDMLKALQTLLGDTEESDYLTLPEARVLARKAVARAMGRPYGFDTKD